jgi:hypothetical protein
MHRNNVVPPLLEQEHDLHLSVSVVNEVKVNAYSKLFKGLKLRRSFDFVQVWAIS